ncbi:MAG: hypothetical protein ACTHJM_04650 [Marmoricola sp.]
MRFRPAVAAAAIPILALTLAACGESAVDKYVKTAPAKVDQDMRDGLTALKSVHVHTVQQGTSGTFTIDMSIDSTGRCVGTLAQGTMTLQLVGLGAGKVYAKGSGDFWASEGASATDAAKLADKWVTGLPQNLFTDACGTQGLIKSYKTNSVSQDKPKVLGKTKIDGVDAVNLQITLNGTKVTLAISASSPHRILKVTAASVKLTTLYTKFDEPVRATAPSGAQDISKLAPSK